jgi:hypothetical protein
MVQFCMLAWFFEIINKLVQFAGKQGQNGITVFEMFIVHNIFS